MKEKRKELLIIIPAYNEEQNIGKLFENLQAAGVREYADLLVINDASKDNTAKVCREYGVHLVTHVYNLGYGCGLQSGYMYGLKYGYRYIIQMDADGQHDVSNVSGIYAELVESEQRGKPIDLVLGSRFVKGAPGYPTTLLKSIAYTLFRFLIWLGTGQKIMDPTTGLQGLSRKAFCFYAGYNHFDDKYPDANMIMQMVLLGFRVKEIPALMHTRTVGVSMHSGIKPAIYMFRMMFSIIAVWIRIKLFRVDVEAVHVLLGNREETE